MLFITNFLITIAYNLSKISLILLYRRVFGVHRWFRHACDALTVFLVCWILTCPVYVFGILPVNANWNSEVHPTHSVNARNYTIALLSADVATDVVLFIMPLFLIAKLQMPLRQRIGVGIALAIGAM